ncbi:unnamed protein product [Mesocestoides corti]|uniref:Synergin gamma C-terminal domain-containing protein n=1 Tax=Mesocestoides corti TaxID=53468 RepID=A0A158QTM8_MESCO|nr:unnamed protein product [Mesocestoides corti]
MDDKDKQKRYFAITKSKLQHMRHDPSVSIDDFISKMFVSSDSGNAKSFTGSSNATTTPENPSDMIGSSFLEPPFSNLKTTAGPAVDDFTWGPMTSAVKSTLSQANSTANEECQDDFGNFASFEPAFQTPTSTSKPTLVVDLSQQEMANVVNTAFANPVSSPVSQFHQSANPSDPSDEFDDFVGSSTVSTQPPSAFFPQHLPQPPKEPAVDSNPANLADWPGGQQDASLDDAFQDFQGCTYEPPAEQEQLPTEDWLKCLSECHAMLSKSSSILSSLVTDADVDAFLSTARGNEFIFELIEIYGVAQRIRLAASIHKILDTQLQTAFNHIDDTWAELARFVRLNDHKSVLKRLLSQPTEAAAVVNPLAVEPNCGVCVTPVSPDAAATIALAGRTYHVTCANLWVNRIELALPTLRAP